MPFDDITLVNDLPIDIQCSICYQMNHPMRSLFLISFFIPQLVFFFEVTQFNQHKM